MKVSVFIPAYNARGHLSQTIARIEKDFWSQIEKVHIINDGSADDTAEIAAQLSAQYGQITVHNLPYNQGYGAVVRYGLAQALRDSSAVVVCLHGDGQYAPEMLGEICAPIVAGELDLVQGSRHAHGTAAQGGMPRYKIWAGRALCALENRVFKLKMTDYHSGYLAYSTAMLQKLPFAQLKGDFEMDLELIALARAQGFSVGEIAIPTRYADEVSYLNPWRYGLRVLRVMQRFKRGFYHNLEQDCNAF